MGRLGVEDGDLVAEYVNDYDKSKDKDTEI